MVSRLPVEWSEEGFMHTEFRAESVSGLVAKPQVDYIVGLSITV